MQLKIIQFKPDELYILKIIIVIEIRNKTIHNPPQNLTRIAYNETKNIEETILQKFKNIIVAQKTTNNNIIYII